MKVEAALGLGGNLGEPVPAFARALTVLAAHPAVELLEVSSVWRTAPWGRTDQPEFLNMAVLIASGLSARDILHFGLALELEGGRLRDERWGPRTLDIDLLTYGAETIAEPGLTVPHPGIPERGFVLAPLAEIAPQLVIGGRTVVALRDALGLLDARRDATETARLRGLLAA